MRLLPIALAAMLLLASAAANNPEELSAAVEAARESGQRPHPDQTLWREAIRTGEQARAAEPGSAEVLRLLARLYSEVSWHIRAYDTWLEFASVSGEAPDEQAFAEAAHQLGFARYSAGDLAGALEYYRALASMQPGNAGALYWLGRSQLESGADDAAAATFRELGAHAEADSLAASQLRLANQVAVYGAAAGRSFAHGLNSYDSGDVSGALSHFEAAFEANMEFTQAAVWAGRSALELGEPGLAARYWRWAVDLDPSDERSRYFLGLAERQDRWGADAVAEFDRGQEQYQAGALTDALASFEAAFRLSPGYLDALSWSARVAQELGRFEVAVDYWSRVLSLDPDDQGARYFMNMAGQRVAFGSEVSDAFLHGVGLYQQADFAAAEEEFLAVTLESPEFAPAWGYLGQIYFSQRRYALAADAYETARRLEPDNEEYTFFAMEALRLADTVE